MTDRFSESQDQLGETIMMSKIALCADSQCLNDPATLGLKGERILDQTWIVPFADALIARKYLREHNVAET